MTLEAERQLAITRNRALLRDLNILRPSTPKALPISRPRPSLPKKRKLESNAIPSRTSARIANAQITYAALSSHSDSDSDPADRAYPKRRVSKPSKRHKAAKLAKPSFPAPSATHLPPHPDLPALRAGWSSWTPTAPAPTRSPTTNTFHFRSHPLFTPNKSPPEMLREGCFGGSYFRPLYSKHLHTTIQDDWRELPADWTSGLDPDRYLTNPTYDAEVNKFRVKCGQSIEEWEAAGWIAHAHDVRGWFQWYCRFFRGRRCADDERQVGRWAKCVGPKGRWRGLLMKKYVQMGVREVFDDGEDEDGKEVSPVMHQTCFHWGWEVRQEALDEAWKARAKE